MENLKWTSKNNCWKLQCNPELQEKGILVQKSGVRKIQGGIGSHLIQLPRYCFIRENREWSEPPCSMFAWRPTERTKCYVGRESNPGQLLGRQLCSPLYHRRHTKIFISISLLGHRDTKLNLEQFVDNIFPFHVRFLTKRLLVSQLPRR